MKTADFAVEKFRFPVRNNTNRNLTFEKERDTTIIFFSLPISFWFLSACGFWHFLSENIVLDTFFLPKTKIGTTSKLAKTRDLRKWSTYFDVLSMKKKLPKILNVRFHAEVENHFW